VVEHRFEERRNGRGLCENGKPGKWRLNFNDPIKLQG
jgi:hypothetical protein